MRIGTRIPSLTCVLAILLAGIGLAGNPAAAEDGKAWIADELQTRLVDHTFFTGGGKGKNKWRTLYYLNPDGTAVGKAWGEGWKYTVSGTWTIIGDTICSKWSHQDWGEGCYEYSDKGKYIRSRGVSGYNKGRSFLAKDLGQGNLKNLK